MEAAKDLEKVISWILSEGMTSGAFVSGNGRTTSWNLTYGTPMRLEVSTSSKRVVSWSLSELRGESMKTIWVGIGYPKTKRATRSERKAVETLVDEFTSRHPTWRECKLWVTRHGKRKQLKPEMIERLAAKFSVSGKVIVGQGFPEKVPTANIQLNAPLAVGCYLGEAMSGDKFLGNAAVWVMPHAPMVAETYISDFDGDLYGTFLTVRKMKKLNRGNLKKLYDKALV